MMTVINKQVWKMLVSPKDRHLKNNYDLQVNEHKIQVKLYNSNERLLTENGDYDSDDDEEEESTSSDSDNNHKYSKRGDKQNKYRCFKRRDNYVTRYYLARRQANTISIAERKLIVIFPGRNFSFTQIKKIKYFEKLYKTEKIDDFDVAILIYPIKTRNLRTLAQSCEKALTHLIDEHGYRNQNMHVMGWCLGGYFANETLEYYYETHPDLPHKFSCFINNKSFSSINEFLYFILPRYLRFILKFYPVKVHVRVWNKDSSTSIEKCKDIFEKIFIVYNENDNIISGLAHLYKHVTVDESSNLKVYEDLEQTNHLPNWNLIAKIFNSAA